jgi:hypothetical protein
MTRRFVCAGLLFAAGLFAADDLPKGEVILDKYVDATGGKAAYAKVKSDISTGSMTFAAMGLTGKMVVYSQAPDKRSAEVTLEGIGKIVEGSNGDIAWSFNAMQGPRLKDGDEKAQSLAQAKYSSDANWRDIYKSAETQGVEAVDGKDCYKVLMTPKVGKQQTRWYDKQTGLLAKMAMTVESPMGSVTVETVPSEYRKEGEILLPHKMVNKMAGQEFSMTIDKVDQNVEIPAEKLEPPAEVKALLNKGAAPAPAPAPAKK